MYDLANSWKAARYPGGTGGLIPASPGIYVIAKVTRIGGLPVAFEPLYAGKSRDLRRRWSEHRSTREVNPGLIAPRISAGLEFWWRHLEVAHLDAIEMRLIGDLLPPANRRGKRNPVAAIGKLIDSATRGTQP